MGNFLTAVDIPVGVWHWMRRRALRRKLQQHVQTILGMDLGIERPVHPQFSKERVFARANSAPNNRNAHSRKFRLNRRDRARQSIEIIRRSFAKRILLVRCPKVRRKLLHKLRWLVDPVEPLDRRCQLYLGEFPKPLSSLLGGK